MHTTRLSELNQGDIFTFQGTEYSVVSVFGSEVTVKAISSNKVYSFRAVEIVTVEG